MLSLGTNGENEDEKDTVGDEIDFDRDVPGNDSVCHPCGRRVVPVIPKLIKGNLFGE
jgi:hypothetical protein